MNSETALEFFVKLRGINYTDIVEATGVTRQMVSAWAKGIRPIAKKHIPMIAEILNAPESSFSNGISEIEKLKYRKYELLKDCTRIGISFEEL